MKNSMPSAAIALLAFAIIFHGLVQLARPTVVTMANPQPVAAQNLPTENQPPVFYVGRDTYLITSAADGRSVFLWYYDFSPERQKNSLEYVTAASVR